jgi:hypothetical protein
LLPELQQALPEQLQRSLEQQMAGVLCKQQALVYQQP